MFDASGQRRIIGFGEARQREDDDSVFEVGQPGERCLTVSLGSGFVGPELGAALLEEFESAVRWETVG